MDSLALSKDDIVLEIGPGKGALTGFLVEQAKSVYAVELDRNLVELLREKFKSAKNLEIIAGDILKFDLSNRLHSAWKIKIAGNLPYQITSPILGWLVEYRKSIDSAVLTIQREVARRICSSPGTKDWSPISIFCQVYTIPELLFDISPGSFFPAPQVHSSVIRLKFLTEPLVDSSQAEGFFNLVHKIFTGRRKTLVKSLLMNYKISREEALHLLAGMNLNEKIRGEKLSIGQLGELSVRLPKLTSD